jgi:hypothetical protein
MSSLKIDPDTTLVLGIICNECKKEQPPKTLTELMQGLGCPCRSSLYKLEKAMIMKKVAEVKDRIIADIKDRAKAADDTPAVVLEEIYTRG